MSIRILHIDTSGSSAIVMVAEDGRSVSCKVSETERDHAGKINHLVAAALEAADCSLEQMDAVAVCNGPGSYTGLRIGLASAKGYCYALEKPLILHNRLQLMLYELDARIDKQQPNRLAILPARAGEYYVAASGEFETEPTHIITDVLIQALSKANALFSSIGRWGDDLYQLKLIQEFRHEILDMSVWAVASFEAFTNAAFADVAYAEPEYLKSTFITASRTDR